ncbi:MAG TPA: ABC-F family ATP-binding cassette domain-containing protein, partial [Acidobacteriota bacterium]|nr:ABC-F family ATP-binding cassette domain-containing protein [Acidobacteriota bacterium]
DEPTNHLDIPAVEWLEQFLAEASCAVILVSHDRVFLERFGGRVVDMVDGNLETYDGNYSYYRTEQPKRRERRRKAWELQSAEIARIEDFIVRNIAGQKTKQAQSRRRSLAKVERLEKPAGDGPAMTLGFEAERRSFRDVLSVHNYTKEIGGRMLLSGVTFSCERGDKVGVMGPNGTGKSTMLRALVGEDDDYSGRIRIGDRVEVAYFDQHLDTLSGTGRVIDEIWEAHPYFDAGPLRSYLARFLFTGEDVFKNVADLSGGEKNRLALARLMLTKANFLVLDEPTNHLDIAAREVLEEALAEFEGTALVVSHDRRFLDRIATKILYVADGTVTLSLGNYSNWIARRAAVETIEEKQPHDVSDAAREWQEQKRVKAEARRIARRRQELETAVAEHERRLQQTETELADEAAAHDWKRLAGLTEERTRLYDELGALYELLEKLPGDVPE